MRGRVFLWSLLALIANSVQGATELDSINAHWKSVLVTDSITSTSWSAPQNDRTIAAYELEIAEIRLERLSQKFKTVRQVAYGLLALFVLLVLVALLLILNARKLQKRQEAKSERLKILKQVVSNRIPKSAAENLINLKAISPEIIPVGSLLSIHVRLGGEADESIREFYGKAFHYFDDKCKTLGVSMIRSTAWHMRAWINHGDQLESTKAPEQILTWLYQELEDFAIQHLPPNKHLFVRHIIGTGPFIAGPLGVCRIQYDLFGETALEIDKQLFNASWKRVNSAQ